MKIWGQIFVWLKLGTKWRKSNSKRTGKRWKSWKFSLCNRQTQVQHTDYKNTLKTFLIRISSLSYQYEHNALNLSNVNIKEERTFSAFFNVFNFSVFTLKLKATHIFLMSLLIISRRFSKEPFKIFNPSHPNPGRRENVPFCDNIGRCLYSLE